MDKSVVRDSGNRSYKRERTVQWSDSDPATLINAPRAFDFAVESIEGFYRDILKLSFLDLLQKRQMGAPFVHASCDYKTSLYESQSVELTLFIERLGRSSVTWHVDAMRNDMQVFQVCMVSSFIELNSMRSVTIPDDLRQKMQPYLHNET